MKRWTSQADEHRATTEREIYRLDDSPILFAAGGEEDDDDLEDDDDDDLEDDDDEEI